MRIDADQLRLFATLLGSPNRESLGLLESLSVMHPWLVEPVLELKTMPLELWQAAHTALFINGYPHTAAPPFISALRHGQMGGQVEEDLAGFYRQLGLQADGMPADYLGTLFECAAWLKQEQTQAGRYSQLWRQYLSPVLPDFANRLREHSALKLYRGMGRELSRLYHV